MFFPLCQGPHVLKNPKIFRNQQDFDLKLKLTAPWLILIRICDSSISLPARVKSVRIRSIDNTKMLIFWRDHQNPNNERCVKTYEIYYAPPSLTFRMKWVFFVINYVLVYFLVVDFKYSIFYSGAN